MTAKKWDVVLIEDDNDRRPEFEDALRVALRPRFNVTRFDTGTKPSEGAYEDRLYARLKKLHLALIVTDRDLSKMEHYPGLSEAPVSTVATRLTVPVCVYASGKPATFLERQRSGGGGRILVDPVPERLAQQVKAIAHGFVQLREVVQGILKNKTTRKKFAGPASVLADVLEAPEMVDQLALYGRGDRGVLAGLTPSEDNTKDEEVRRVSLMLGVWLYDSVLRYPGVILDAIAAGSFLGVEPKVLSEPAVIRLFESAGYRGPFADDSEPRWWRHRLLEVIEESGAQDAREMIEQTTKKAPAPCKCSVDNKAPAGFVCMMTGRPVCDKHSVGEVSWFPRGADLARIRTDKFEQIGPFIGMS